jgi:hypothetical protein
MASNGRRLSSDIEIGERPKIEGQLPTANSSEHIEVGTNPIAGVQAALRNPMPMYDIPLASVNIVKELANGYDCRALLGFLMSLTPVTNALMGWRGAGGLGAAEVQVIFSDFLGKKQDTNLLPVAYSISSVVFLWSSHPSLSSSLGTPFNLQYSDHLGPSGYHSELR